ncbi:MAG: DNA polymerase II large subunit, partial [Thermoplasmata archaeon]
RIAISNIPVEITGEGTEKIEVSGYRDLERIETNQLRGGAVLVLAEGVLQKAPKIMKHMKKFNLGWGWLEQFINKGTETEENVNIEPSYKYIKDLVAGRPVISYPSSKGGLRLRYGRSRNSGYAAACLHPATMYILDDFIAIGTQIKTERPGKACAVSVCDTIEPPIVKLEDGSVIRLESIEQVEKIKNKIKEILFLGDILISYGDFLENNHILLPSGYVEEWWEQEVEKKGKIITKLPSQEEAIKLSEELNIPLHPRYTYFYHDVDKEDLKDLVLWLCRNGKIVDNCLEVEFDSNFKEKRILELLCVPHKVKGRKIIIEEYKPLIRVLGIWDLNYERFIKIYEKAKDSMEIVNSFGIIVRKKAPTYIGARMGRPEKAKERRMQPPVNVLFPIGEAGGRTRDIKKASLQDKIEVEICKRVCRKCGKVTFKTLCPNCKQPTELVKLCSRCGKEINEDYCPICKRQAVYFEKREIEIKKIFKEAVSRVGNSNNDLKGVIGMTSEYKIPEPLEKGILRSKHGVYVFKDGTSRFDATDLPLTHFKPKEIGTSIEKLRELGYTHDIEGNPLTNSEQLLELKCQDVILPEKGGEYLLKVSKFIDELLVKLYGLEPYYNAEKKEDLIGHLILGLAPHTSAAIVGRIIGYTKANACFAHPYWHAAKRRNCDGDEDSIFLLMDAFLNFSKYFLPSSRGGKMDAPLVLTTKLDPREVDDESHNLDIVARYPIEFYEATLRYARPQEVEELIETVSQRLGKEEQFYGFKFTHDTSDINSAPTDSSYKTLKTMMEKVEHQLTLAKKILAVDEQDVARRVIESHFLPDLAGNLRTFSKQSFRCVNCNAKYRRIPLIGKCRRCGGRLVLTVPKGAVEKYLKVTKQLIEEYHLDDYLKQRIKILEMSISSVFEDETVKQASIFDF